MIKTPKVTVITVVFNLIKNGREATFRQCLESVHNQTFKETEHLVIDGGSQDGTLTLIKEYANKGLIKYISEPDKGIYDAMNKGLRMAKGKYVAFLNSDDFWHDTRGVEKSYEALEKSGADFSFAPVYYLDENDEHLGVLDDMMGAFFIRMPFSHQSMFTKRDVLLKEEGFSLEYKSASDYDLVLRLCLKGYKFIKVDSNFTSFRRTGISAVEANSLGDKECEEILYKQYSKFGMSEKDIKRMFYNFIYPKSLYKKIYDSMPAEYQKEMDMVVQDETDNGANLVVRQVPFINKQKLTTILYDATTLFHFYDAGNPARTGIFFVAYNVLMQLAKHEDVKIFLTCALYAKDVVGRFYDEHLSKYKNVKLYNGEEVNVYFSPYYQIPQAVRDSGVTTASILYDTIPLLFPQFYPELKEEDNYYLRMLRSYTPKDHFFSISEHTKQDYARLVKNIDPEKITVITLAASDNFFKAEDAAKITRVKNKYKIPLDKKYIFSLCSLEPRKNLAYCAKNFFHFIEENKIEDMIFVMGGTQWDAFIAELEKQIDSLDKFKNKILRIGYVEDADLPYLYSGAFCLTYPSLYEGFGLPPLEAMKCGCPVITSDNSSLPEVVGDAGIMVDITKEYAVSAAIKKLYDDPALRAELGEKGHARAQHFTWEKCVKIIIDKLNTLEKSYTFVNGVAAFGVDWKTNARGSTIKEKKIFGVQVYKKIVDPMYTRKFLFGLQLYKKKRTGRATVFYLLGIPVMKKNNAGGEKRKLFGKRREGTKRIVSILGTEFSYTRKRKPEDMYTELIERYNLLANQTADLQTKEKEHAALIPALKNTAALAEKTHSAFTGMHDVMHKVTAGENTLVILPRFLDDVTLGKGTYIATNSIISQVDIGRFCSIGPNFMCGFGIHPTNGISTSPAFYSLLKQNGMTYSASNKTEERKKINIGNDVFIGMNVSVLDGVSIGDGAVIAAGAVVTKDIPPYAVAAGVPAEVKKYRFDEDTINKLLAIKWWDWNDEKLQNVEQMFFDVKGFTEKYYKEIK